MEPFRKGPSFSGVHLPTYFIMCVEDNFSFGFFYI
tara:strand:- start:11 stop:115 length:105 start_codon:yes stop_codon:yes gene_type:complete